MAASNIPWPQQFPSSSGGYQAASWSLAHSDSVSGGGIEIGIWTRLNYLEKAITELCERIEALPAVYNVQLFDLGSPAYRLATPLLVAIEAYPDEVIARVPTFDVYAAGLSDSMALANLQKEILSMFERYSELGEEKLAAVALLSFRAMREVINLADE